MPEYDESGRVIRKAYSATTLGALFQYLNEDLKDSSLSLKMCIFLAEKNISELLSTNEIKRVKEKVTVLDTNQEILKYDFTLYGNLGDTQEGSGIYFKHPSFDDVYIYVSFDPMFIFKRVLSNYFNKFYPKISQIFLTSNQIKTIIAETSTKLNTSALISRFVVKRPYPNAEVDIKYQHEKIDFKKAFLSAEVDNYDVNSLNVFVRDMDFNVSREGYFVLNSGNFTQFDALVFAKTFEFVKNKKQVYSNRERREENKYEASPLLIKFNHDLFNSVDDMKNLVKRVFDNIERSFYSVSHLNPYLQMSFTGFEDGSSFEIWVLNKNQLFIVPQFRATFPSVTKVINAMFRDFSEGEVIDVKTNNSVELNGRAIN
jgi:hypothetical protein